jgi:hypothetical protein
MKKDALYLAVLLGGLLACGGSKQASPPEVQLIDPTTRQEIFSRIHNPGYKVASLEDDGATLEIKLVLPVRPTSEAQLCRLATGVCENVAIYLRNTRYQGRGVEVLLQSPDTTRPEEFISLGRGYYDPKKNEIGWEGSPSTAG